jgi:hypothetical protein
MSKISIDDLKSWKINEYDDTYCRYALAKIIDPYFDYKSEAEHYKKYYAGSRQGLETLPRHFKLCSNCFPAVIVNGKKRKIVIWVYDRGIRGDFEMGWLCAKCRAEDVKLNRVQRTNRKNDPL